MKKLIIVLFLAGICLTGAGCQKEKEDNKEPAQDMILFESEYPTEICNKIDEEEKCYTFEIKKKVPIKEAVQFIVDKEKYKY